MTIQRHAPGPTRPLGLAAIGLAIALVGGCASEPIVDRRGVDPVAYQRDLAECERYADEVKVAQRAATGAAAGAAVAGVLGAVIGRDGGDWAAVGGTQGAVQGTYSGVQERRQVVRNCLRQRGYAVLN